MRSFFFDSSEYPHEEFFNGYAFQNDRLVWPGSDFGYSLPSGHDGAYVTCYAYDGRLRLGVDYQGSCRLFLYRSPKDQSYWAVSNSLQYLIKKMSERKQPMSLAKDVFTAWSGSGAFLEQMSCFDSYINEIVLIPRWIDLDIIPGETCKIRLTRSPSHGVHEDVSYETALHNYLLSWRRRISSLLSQVEVAQVDLSGGLDSRTTFSLFTPFLDDLGMKDRLRIFSSNASRASADLKVAREIASTLGFNLSNNRVKTSEVVPLSISNIFDRWGDNRLGQYYLGSNVARGSISKSKFSVTGVGGEQYRPFYHKFASDLEGLVGMRRHVFLNKQKKIYEIFLTKLGVGGNGLFGNFKKRVFNSVAEANHENNFLEQDFLTLHYREFRSRFHLGAPATESTKIAPLSGRLMDRLAASAPADYLQNRQIYYDIIANMCPRLLEIPFDDSKKAPAGENLDRITIVGTESVSSITNEGELKNRKNFKNISRRTVPSSSDCMEEIFRRSVDGQKKCPDNINLNHRKEQMDIKNAIEKGRLKSGKSMKYFHFISLCENLKKFDIA